MATPSGRSAHFGRFRTHIPARVGVCPSVPPIPSHARRGVGFCRVGPRDRSTRARGVVICQHRRPDAAPTSANCHARSWVGKLGEPLPTPPACIPTVRSLYTLSGRSARKPLWRKQDGPLPIPGQLRPSAPRTPLQVGATGEQPRARRGVAVCRMAGAMRSHCVCIGAPFQADGDSSPQPFFWLPEIPSEEPETFGGHSGRATGEKLASGRAWRPERVRV